MLFRKFYISFLKRYLNTFYSNFPIGLLSHNISFASGTAANKHFQNLIGQHALNFTYLWGWLQRCFVCSQSFSSKFYFFRSHTCPCWNPNVWKQWKWKKVLRHTNVSRKLGHSERKTFVSIIELIQLSKLPFFLIKSSTIFGSCSNFCSF